MKKNLERMQAAMRHRQEETVPYRPGPRAGMKLLEARLVAARVRLLAVWVSQSSGVECAIRAVRAGYGRRVSDDDVKRWAKDGREPIIAEIRELKSLVDQAK